MRGSARKNGTSLALGVALVVLAVVPTSSAAPIAADLNVTGPLTLTGPATWSAEDSVAYIEAGDYVPSYQLTFTAARALVDVHVMTRDTITAGPAAFNYNPTQTHERHELTDVTLKDLRLAPGARILLDGDERGFHADTQTEQADVFTVQKIHASADPARVDAVPDEAQPYFVAGTDRVVLETTAATTTGTGNVRLSLWNAEIRLDAAGGTATFRAGEEDNPDRPSLGPAEARVKRVVAIDLEGVQIHLEWAGAQRHFAPSPHIQASSLVAPDAAGLLDLDGVRIRPNAERLEMAGALELRPRVLPDAATTRRAMQIIPYDEMGASMGGDAKGIALSGAVVSGAAGNADLVVAAGLGVGLLATLAAAWRVAPFALAALYSRLEQGDLLSNPTRARIYDIIQHNPGINPRKIQRLADASWGTVVHHLRKLVESGLVAVRKTGRTKCFYENHGKWDGYEEPLAILARGKAREIASSITVVPGRDQGDIVGRTGFSQSTVSYHLLKLEHAGLTAKERINGAWCYYPTQRLREILARTGAAMAAPIGGTA